MHLNDDLSVPVVVHAAKLDWVPSPAAGVERRMLFRIGEEKARATSIVRYAPRSRFPHHGHPGGEEFLVLEGTFHDETGDFPAGSYVRNPPGTGHAPGSDEGCTIFVKLWQFRDDDRERIVRLPGEGRRADPGQGSLSSVILFESPYERVGIEAWHPGAAIALSNPRGLEMLVLSGSFSAGQEGFEGLSWLRLPAGKDFRAHAGPNGARIWLKSGQLLQDRLCEF
jgi:quercetin dioxygenase-like cupin family protein